MTRIPGRTLAAPAARLARRFLLVLVALLVPVLGSAQQARKVTASTFDATREQLTAIASGADAAQAMIARDRLATGDFKVGDRFLLILSEPARGDTIVVRDGLVATLSTEMPDMELRGVLRSELAGAVDRHVRRFVRDPNVRVFPLVRLAVQGGVTRPGFYVLQPDKTLSDVIMAAGGPTGNASFADVEIKRGKDVVIDKKRAQGAIREGATLEQLGVAPGDQINVGEKIKRDWLQVTQIAAVTITSLITVYLLAKQLQD